MAKLPAFQFYPGDWRKDPGVQALDYFERGVWIELLCLMHESEEPGRLVLGGKPYPEDRLCRLLGLSPEVMGKVIITLITLNVARLDPETGIVYSKRMVKDRELSSKRAKGGILGGNPNFKAGKPNPYYQKDNLPDNLGDNQKITPSAEDEDEEDLSSLSQGGDPRGGQKKPTAKEEFWDALCRIFALEPKTQSDELRLYQQCGDFRLKGATVEEIERRAGNYRLHFTTAFTPKALLSNWEVCKDAPAPKPKRNAKDDNQGSLQPDFIGVNP